MTPNGSIDISISPAYRESQKSNPSLRARQQKKKHPKFEFKTKLRQSPWSMVKREREISSVQAGAAVAFSPGETPIEPPSRHPRPPLNPSLAAPGGARPENGTVVFPDATSLAGGRRSSGEREKHRSVSRVSAAVNVNTTTAHELPHSRFARASIRTYPNLLHTHTHTHMYNTHIPHYT